MAAIPLNVFKTKTTILGLNTSTIVYTAPVGVTSIILMANAANIDTGTHLVSFSHYRNLPVIADAQGFGGQPGQTFTELVKDFAIPGNNSASLLVGKLALESLDSVVCYSESVGYVKLTMSVLETANA